MHELAHLLGLDNASGAWYLFWSGFFGDVSIFAALVGLYWRHTCHVSGCWRPGLHPFQHYKLCKKHHPEVPDKLTNLHISKLHKEARK